MEQFQGSLLLGFKGDPKILKNFKDQRLCSACTRCTSQCGTFTEMQQDHTLALTNIATATQDDRTLVTLLTDTISELSRQVAHLTAKLATAQAENAQIKKSGHRPTMAQHGHRASSNSTPSDPTSIQGRNL